MEPVFIIGLLLLGVVLIAVLVIFATGNLVEKAKAKPAPCPKGCSFSNGGCTKDADKSPCDFEDCPFGTTFFNGSCWGSCPIGTMPVETLCIPIFGSSEMPMPDALGKEITVKAQDGKCPDGFTTGEGGCKRDITKDYLAPIRGAGKCPSGCSTVAGDCWKDEFLACKKKNDSSDAKCKEIMARSNGDNMCELSCPSGTTGEMGLCWGKCSKQKTQYKHICMTDAKPAAPAAAATTPAAAAATTPAAAAATTTKVEAFSGFKFNWAE